MKAIHHHTLSL